MPPILLAHGDVFTVLVSLTIDIVKMVASVVGALTAVLIVDLFIGAFLFLLRQQRTMLVLLPSTNVMGWLAITWLASPAGRYTEQFQPPGVYFTATALVLLVGCGLLVVAVLVSLRSVVDGIRSANHERVEPRSAKSFGQAVLIGLRSPLRGFAILWRHKSLWQYGLWPVLLNIVITGVVTVLLVVTVVSLCYLGRDWIPDGEYRWAWQLASVVGLIVAAIGMALATWLAAQAILCGYFYSRLALRVELLLGTDPATLREAPLMHQAMDVLMDIAALVTINLGCLAMNVVPILGTIAGLIVSLYYDCLILGREYLDYPLSLRGLRRREKLSIVRRFRGQTIGLGMDVLLLTPIPLVGPVFLVAAVVGAVLLHRDEAMLVEAEPRMIQGNGIT